MNLRELQIGQTARIEAVGGEGALRQHFLDMGMIPGVDAKALKGAKLDDKAMSRQEAIILSMTQAEREKPAILNSSRKRRIAAGAGVGVVDINRLLKQFEMMQTMARQFSGKGAKKMMRRAKMGGGGFPFGF